jgi:hypothetical protein
MLRCPTVKQGVGRGEKHKREELGDRKARILHDSTEGRKDNLEAHKEAKLSKLYHGREKLGGRRFA